MLIIGKSAGWFSYTRPFVIFFIQFCIIDTKALEDYVDSKEKSSQVEVRAVFIECAEREDVADSELARFQRQERFKHNALHDCNKKLALTVKMASEPNFRLLDNNYKSQQMPGEEYIPIDHVFEGPERKRVRLLNPYILRLRRDAPLQAYKLNRIDTVSGVFTKSEKTKYSADKENGKNLIRTQRDTENVVDDWGQAAVFTLEHDQAGRRSFSIRIANPERPNDHASNLDNQVVSKDCGLRLFALNPHPVDNLNASAHSLGNLVDDSATSSYVCFNDNVTLIREKRHGQNIIIEGSKHNKKCVIKDHHHDDKTEPSDNDSFVTSQSNDSPLDPNEVKRYVHHHKNSRKSTNENYSQDNKKTSAEKNVLTKMHTGDKKEKKRLLENGFDEELYSDYPERTFALYEIGNPNVWYNVQVQLFEKLSAPDGKTVWNDLTNGAVATVSSMIPEWKGHDIHLRYRPAEYIGRDEFTLPKTSLCLLEPLSDGDSNFTANADNMKNDYSDQYVVVPIEDIIAMEEPQNVFKREDNTTDSTPTSEEHVERHRRVQVRVSRALIGSNIDNFNVANHGLERFLTLPHRKSHRAQIDVEVQADDNQLVRVGSSGRLSTIVSDHTRKSRTVLIVQATNTGLASTGFTAIVRDCGPELTELFNEKSSERSTAGPILIPPYHTQKFRIELPIEFPVDTAHCSVALVNDDDETVAVRDVAVKKGDRCFCVFHCDCVCLSEDPKLLCREMSETRKAAAGLNSLGHLRHTRSTQYFDSISLDAWGSAIGVIIFLLAIGLCKAFLGLFSVSIGNWGLNQIVTPPRNLDNYFEQELKGQQVVYDDTGRPVHPLTHRPVRMFSRSTQFILNLIFFVALPAILITKCLKGFFALITPKAFNTSCKNISEKCFSSHDMQNVKLFIRRRRYDLQKWMTPPAEELTESIWKRGLSIGEETTTKSDNHNPSPMQPLLSENLMNKVHRDTGHSNVTADPDSEQDDTEYVLTQMQKSRESLARSQKKQNESRPSSIDRNHYGKGDLVAAHKHT